jgi:hypothetical protein
VNLKHYSSSIKTWECMKVFNIHHFFKAFHEQFHGKHYTWCGTPFLMAASHMSHNTKVSKRFRSWTGIGNSHKIWIQFLTGKLMKITSNWVSSFGLSWLVYMDTYGAFCTIEKRTGNKWHPLPLLLRSTCANMGICPTCHVSPQTMTQKSTSSQHNVASGFSWKGHFFFTAILFSFTITWFASLTPPSVQHG